MYSPAAAGEKDKENKDKEKDKRLSTSGDTMKRMRSKSLSFSSELNNMLGMLKRLALFLINFTQDPNDNNHIISVDELSEIFSNVDEIVRTAHKLVGKLDAFVDEHLNDSSHNIGSVFIDEVSSPRFLHSRYFI